MENEITVEQQEKIKAETLDLVAQAQGIKIVTEMENTKAATLTAQFKAEIKRRKTILAPTKAALDASKAAYAGLVTLMIDPLDDAVKIITGKIGAFVAAENAHRAELQRKEDLRVAELQAKADAKAAEAQRIADEKFAEAQRKAALANKPPPVAPKYVPPPVIIPQRVVASVAAPAGTSYITHYSAKVVDIKALCAAVAAGQVDDIFVMGNMATLNGHAKIKKMEGQIMPGVVGVKTISTQQRG